MKKTKALIFAILIILTTIVPAYAMENSSDAEDTLYNSYIETVIQDYKY